VRCYILLVHYTGSAQEAFPERRSDLPKVRRFLVPIPRDALPNPHSTGCFRRLLRGGSKKGLCFLANSVGMAVFRDPKEKGAGANQASP